MNRNLLFFNLNECGCLPLVEQLIDRGFSIIVNDSVVLDEAVAAGVNVRRFHEAAPDNASLVADQEVSRILTTIAKGIKLPTVQAAFASPRGQFLTHTGQDFFLSFQQLVTQEVSLIHTFESWLEDTDVNLFVVGSEGPRERTMIRYAQTKGVPTLLLDDLEAPWHSSENSTSPVSDHIATIGTATERRLRMTAGEEAAIYATGLPHFDSYVGAGNRWTRTEARKKLGIKQNLPTILACPGGPDFSQVSFVSQAQKLLSFNQTLIDSIGSMQADLQLVVLLASEELQHTALNDHESSFLEDAYKQWLARRGIQEVHLVRRSTPELLQAVDVVVTFGQKNVVLEALLANRPVIATECHGNLKSLLAGNMMVTFLREEQSLAEVLQTILNNSETAQYSPDIPAELIRSQHGRAAERLRELITDLASGKYSTGESRNDVACFQNPILGQLYQQIDL